MFGVFGNTFTSVDYRFNVGVLVVGLEGEDVGLADCIREAENRNFEYGMLSLIFMRLSFCLADEK